MSSFINLLSDGCVDFEKCGDVVVSPKDNIIGMFCHFCSDIFTNLVEFLHHLQWVHNDVIAFTKEHNVYTMEELMSLTDCSAEVLEGPVTAKDSNDCLSENIMKALAAYDVDCGQIKEHESLESTIQCQTEVAQCAISTAATESQLELDLLEHEQLLNPAKQQEPLAAVNNTSDISYPMTPITSNQSNKANNRKKLHQAVSLKLTNHIQETGSRIKSSRKVQPLCNLRSYAIARAARKREQQQRLGDVKKRIFRCLENDENSINVKPFKDIKQLQPIRQTQKKSMIAKLKPISNTKGEIKLLNSQKENCAKEDIAETALKTVEMPANAVVVNTLTSNIVKQSLNTKCKLSSPIAINKIEYLPRIHLKKTTKNWNNIIAQTAKPIDEKTKPRRRSSLTVVSSADMVDTNNILPSQDQSIKTVANNNSSPKNKRKLPIFKPSRVEVKRSKAEDNSNEILNSKNLETDSKALQLDAQLADPPIEKKQPQTSTDESNEMKLNHVRDDVELLHLVGLIIIRDPKNEDRKPFEYVEELHSKAANFSKILRNYEMIWNPKRFNGQFTDKFRQQLAMLNKETNTSLKTNLNVSELKRILNLINTWYVDQINLKFFRKVALSQAVEFYVLLFGFLPKINRWHYYCEWCEENCANKSRYEKHRLTHQGIYFCPYCQRGFKKRGYLINHTRTIHGKEASATTKNCST